MLHNSGSGRHLTNGSQIIDAVTYRHYNLKTDHRPTLMTKLARWYDRVWKMGLKCFNTVLQTFMNNYQTILHYFDNRSTNASAESFNAKGKAFRAQFRGVRDISFFIFRLAKIFA